MFVVFFVVILYVYVGFIFVVFRFLGFFWKVFGLSWWVFKNDGDMSVVMDIGVVMIKYFFIIVVGVIYYIRVFVNVFDVLV